MTAVRIPPTLRAEVGGERSVEAEGDTVRAVLEDLVARHPALGAQIFSDGEVATFVNVYLGGEDVRTLDGLDTAVTPGQTVILLPAMAGGSTPPRSLPVVSSLLDLVGNTPLVELTRISPKSTVKMYAKLEGQNPTGSIKDRVAKSMIEAAEASGELTPGRHLLEPTSGNTGHSLAMIAKLRGYPLTCVMPENATEERKRMLRLYGAEIVLSPGAEGSNGAVRLALGLAERDSKYFMPFQYANPANPRAHYETTGPEILDACPEIDAFVAGLGTGGTLTGVARYFRDHKPGVKIYAAEPMPGENVQGLRSLEDGFVPEVFDPSLLDGKYLVSNREAIVALRELIAREGIFAGPSCGAVLVAAARVALAMGHGTIVALLPDGGWKYMSAGTYDRDLAEMEDALEGGVHWW